MVSTRVRARPARSKERCPQKSERSATRRKARVAYTRSLETQPIRATASAAASADASASARAASASARPASAFAALASALASAAACVGKRPQYLGFSFSRNYGTRFQWRPELDDRSSSKHSSKGSRGSPATLSMKSAGALSPVSTQLSKANDRINRSVGLWLSRVLAGVPRRGARRLRRHGLRRPPRRFDLLPPSISFSPRNYAVTFSSGPIRDVYREFQQRSPPSSRASPKGSLQNTLHRRPLSIESVQTQSLAPARTL